VQQAQAAGKSTDSRAAALHAIAAAGTVANTVASAASAMAGSGGVSIGLKLSFGKSQSKSTFTEDKTTNNGSSVLAGGTAAFVATGNGTPGSGNVTVAGSDINANDVVLSAKNQVNLLNTTDTDSTKSTNESSSSSFGVSVTYGTGGWGAGVSGSMSNAHGDSSSNSATQNNTHVNGANSVTITSGGDTNIIGSDVTGGKVTANVGGNLDIESVQDTTVSEAHQSSTSAGFSLSTNGGGSASFSAMHGSANGSYAGVNEQAGIYAGAGGFNINVNGNTNLTGAVISSTADASKNSLSTGTLTFSDLQNHSDYSASSNGIGLSLGGSWKTGENGTIVNGTGSVSPMIGQSDSGSDSATTRSAVSAGTITITNPGAQTQDVSTLNRDTADTNGTVSKLPNVKTILSNQADVMKAAQAAGQQVEQGIGTVANYERDQATTRALDEGWDAVFADYGDDPDKANALNEKANADWASAAAWDTGGQNRNLLQAVGGTMGGALIGGLGGGSAFTALGGAAGAGLSYWMAVNVMPQVVKTVMGTPIRVTASSTPWEKMKATAEQMGNNLAGSILSVTAGYLAGGSAGAATASNVFSHYKPGKDNTKKPANASDGQ